MFGRSKKIEAGVLQKTHTILADVAQDVVERLVKERVRWVGVTVRFTHQGPCKNGEKYEATVRGYCKKFEKGGAYGVHATFKVCVYGTNSVVFEEGALHKFAFEFRHEYWDHYHLRMEADDSILIRSSSIAARQDPWTKADGTQVVLPELHDL